MTVFLAIMGPVVAITLVLMAWGWLATRKPMVINADMRHRPWYYRQAERELRGGELERCTIDGPGTPPWCGEVCDTCPIPQGPATWA